MQDFKNIEYLKSGNARQKLAYKALKRLKIFEHLKNYTPILTGTIPIDIDLPDSDLDIICQCKDHTKFSSELLRLFADESGFEINSYEWRGKECTVARFTTEDFEVEIFGQDLQTDKQYAYRHMLIEYQILNQKGPEFKSQIRKLKEGGLKTEPAFATLLKLKGDPYEALLRFEI